MTGALTNYISGLLNNGITDIIHPIGISAGLYVISKNSKQNISYIIYSITYMSFVFVVKPIATAAFAFSIDNFLKMRVILINL